MSTIHTKSDPSRLAAWTRFLAAAFTSNLKAVLEYRANFLLQVFGMMLNNAAFALFWGVLIARTGGVGGYGFSDIMLVWALVSTSFGVAHVLFGNMRSLSSMIQKGELDVYLLQPKNVFVNVLVSRTIVSAWGDLAYGYIVLALLPGLGLGHLLLFTGLALTGAVIIASAFSMSESLAFFLGDSSSVSGSMAEFLLSFSLYPEKIYGPELRWLFYSLFPSGFIAFVPLAALKALSWVHLPLLAGVALLYALAAFALFKRGLRRYESGNQMGTRL